MHYSVLFSIFFLVSSHLFAQSYISLGYGVAESSSDANYVDGVDGNVITFAYGKRTSPNFAWELTFRKTSFDANTASFDILGQGGFEITTEIDVMSFGGG